MEEEKLKIIARIIQKNKKTYNSYIRFRKKIFSELASKESEVILYMLPWLLSINHPACPGYIADLKQRFRVFNVDNEEIRKREPLFKNMFNITQKESLLTPPSVYCLIQGIYTIGSVGSIAQTSGSDCDIWICYDKKDFNETAWSQLNKKLNFIKDWMDLNIRMPVFFFISDVNDIKYGRFGSVDSESSGSAQRNVLKEEFYRTTILICGKIPLWWVSYDDNFSINYEQALKIVEDERYDEYELIDFGNLEKIEKSEYLGAALWQFHKSLYNPLKSIIKMALLKMLLDAPDDSLICHKFRKQILIRENHNFFPDPSVLTMLSIFDCYKNKKVLLKFLKECFFLRCEIKSNEERGSIKNKLAGVLFKEYVLEPSIKTKLSSFSSWSFEEQINLGNHLFKFLLYIYKEIFSTHTCLSNEIDNKDLTILGRIIGARYEQKEDKIPIINKPNLSLNISELTLVLDNNIWYVYPASNTIKPLIFNEDIVYILTYIVWNNLFAPNWTRMEPNSSSITLQEIINLGNKIRETMLTHYDSNIDHSNYIKKERIIKMLIIISFEKSPFEKNINDFCVVYKNSWGELFVKRLSSKRKFEAFLIKTIKPVWNVEMTYYFQRNSTYYDKIIDRTKKIIASVFNSQF